jgi:hypothetical protein
MLAIGDNFLPILGLFAVNHATNPLGGGGGGVLGGCE